MIMLTYFLVSLIASTLIAFLGFTRVMLPGISNYKTNRLSNFIFQYVSSMNSVFPGSGGKGTGKVKDITLGDEEGAVQVQITEGCLRKLNELKSNKKEAIDLNGCGVGDNCLCFVRYNASKYGGVLGLGGEQHYKWGETPNWVDEDKYSASSAYYNFYYYNGSEKKPNKVLGPLCEDFFEEENAIRILQCKEMRKEIEKEQRIEDVNYYWTETTPYCLKKDLCHEKYILWVSADSKASMGFDAKALHKDTASMEIYYIRRWLPGA